MNLLNLVSFAAASCLLALTPGPDIITVITRSVTQGTRAGLVATLGFASGVTVHTSAAALGLTLLLQALPSAQWAIRIAGAAYLVYLAIRMLLARDPIAIDVNFPAQRTAMSRIYWQSVLMNILNPKVTLFFFTFLWPFVDPESPFAIDPKASLARPFQFAILGALFALCTIACFGICALIAGHLSTWLRRRPNASRPMRIITAALFIGIAVRIVLP